MPRTKRRESFTAWEKQSRSQLARDGRTSHQVSKQIIAGSAMIKVKAALPSPAASESAYVPIPIKRPRKSKG